MPRRAPMSGLLRCPHCAGALTRGGDTWRCPSGHAFDVARQGYVNLLPAPSPHAGDTAAMLDRRAAVLARGHLAPVTTALVTACGDELPDGALVEIGAGTAHHLAQVRAANADRLALAVDVSVAAARRAARQDPAWLTAVVADVWQPWPVLDGVAAAVLSVFGPRNAAESARVLVPGGRLVVVVPAAEHLQELREPLGLLGIEPGKLARLRDETAPHLTFRDTHEVRATTTVTRDEATAVAAMGPSAHHVSLDELARRSGALAERVDVTVAVHVVRFERGAHG